MTLIDRLSKLDGPDRNVDAEIDRAFGLHVDVGEFSGPWTRYPETDHYRATSRYTASVDACLALAERALPGWQVNVTFFHEGLGEASVGSRDTAKIAVGANPAIAACIALLRAKESEQ